MKCNVCNERDGSARCEGCQQLYCLPCMNKHHDELVQEFQQVMDTRNQLKEELDQTESASKNDHKRACMVRIDRWEIETIERIRGSANRARMNVEELIQKNKEEIRHRFKQVSDDIQLRQKNENYLEVDINTVRSQLEQLRTRISSGYANIHVNIRPENECNWDTVIFVNEKDEQNRFRPEYRELSKAARTQQVSHRNSASYIYENSTPKLRPDKDADEEKRITMSRSSIMVDFDQRTDRIRLCSECKRNFVDSQSTSVCANCDQKIKYDPVRHQTMPMQNTFAPINPPSYDGSDPIPRGPPIPKMRDLQEVVCPQCGNMNMIHVTSDRMNHNCEKCGTYLRLPETF